MNPRAQCCAGTSCGVRRNGEHVSNLCVVCRDLGQPCNASRVCCSGLSCQMITEYASVCNPKAHKPFIPKTLSDNSQQLNPGKREKSGKRGKGKVISNIQKQEKKLNSYHISQI